MLKNYLKIALRNLIRHKSNTIINIVGLSVGMACCILIALYVKEELSYDKFHEKAERIVLVGRKNKIFGPSLNTPYALADAMENEIPEVEKALRMDKIRSLRLSQTGKDFMEIKNGKYAEPEFFDAFSFSLLYGNSKSALENPNQIILSLDACQTLFGNKNPVGESLYWQQNDTTVLLKVSGVLALPPGNNSIKTGALVSYNTKNINRNNSDSWSPFAIQTYAVLNSPDAIKKLSSHFRTMEENHYKKSSGRFFALPFTSMYLSELTRDSGFTGNGKFLYLFGTVAVLILIIAFINYVNLSTARVSTRLREVGIRKVVGARKSQLAYQFFGESVLLSFISYLLGSIIALIAISYFNQLFGSNLSINNNEIYLIWLGIGAIGVGLIAGVYPALYLSGFSPTSIFRKMLPTGSKDSLLRKVLVVGQFGIALILIIGSLVIYQQLQYTQTKDLGFNGEQVVSMRVTDMSVGQMRALKNKVSNHPGVQEATVANIAPSFIKVRIAQPPDSLSPQAQNSAQENITYTPGKVDYNFFKLLNIKFLAGRNFSSKHISDEKNACILNKSAAKKLGWSPEEAIGNTFEGKKVIGVIENFHLQSLHKEIEAVKLDLHPAESSSSSSIFMARLHPDHISEALDYLKEEVIEYVPYQIFDYEFLDEKFDAMYRTEERFGRVTGLFTFIAILVACLGLYGLAAFATERRTKEIGIRKSFGASIPNLMGLLSKDFLKLVMLGFVIAVPIAWYAMNRWLQDFAYRIDLSWWYFIAAGLLALVIAWVTVGFHTVRAAMVNPGECLKDE